MHSPSERDIVVGRDGDQLDLEFLEAGLGMVPEGLGRPEAVFILVPQPLAATSRIESEFLAEDLQTQSRCNTLTLHLTCWNPVPLPGPLQSLSSHCYPLQNEEGLPLWC